MKKGTIRRLDALATDGVERADPAGPPTAFRIWKAGVNVTDHGPTIFSERSARLLMAQQEERGNRFPIDVDHLSLDKDAPLENRRAVGWFAIEVRAGELWARDVEWTDVVRDGLTKTPPEWRYHSPAYDQDQETDEVVGLLNLAITNVPATHYVTALASRGAMQKDTSRMKLEDIKAAFEGADDDKKAAAWSAIAKAMASDGSEKETDAEEPDGDEAEKKDSDDGEDMKKDAADAHSDDGEDAKKDSADEPKADAKAASILASLDKELRALKAEVKSQRAEKERSEKASILASKEMSAETRKAFAKESLATVKRLTASMPSRKISKTTESVQGTRGESQADARASRLSPEERAELDRRMGLASRKDSIQRDGASMKFGVMTRDEAVSRVASKGVK